MRALVLLCVLSVVTACGSSDEKGDKDAGGSDGRVYSEAELQDALLVLDDLPKGWKVGEASEGEDEDDDQATCTDDWTGELDGAVDAVFQRSEFGPFLSESLVQLDEDAANEYLATIERIVDECASFTETDDDGAETETRLEEIDAPALGDDAFGVRITMSTGFGQVKLNVYAIRIGGTVAMFGYGGFGGTDSDAADGFAEQGIDKLLALN